MVRAAYSAVCRTVLHFLDLSLKDDAAAEASLRRHAAESLEAVRAVSLLIPPSLAPGQGEPPLLTLSLADAEPFPPTADQIVQMGIAGEIERVETLCERFGEGIDAARLQKAAGILVERGHPSAADGLLRIALSRAEETAERCRAALTAHSSSS